MKILLSSYFALPNTGGLWTYVMQLQQGLQAMGHEVDILAHHPDVQHYYVLGREPLFRKEPAAELFRQHLLPRYPRLCPEEILRMEMQRYELEAAYCGLDISSYDLFHAQDILAARALARVKPRHAPLIATLHGYFTSELLGQGIIRQPNSAHHRYSLAQEKISILSTDAALVPSHWMKNIFLQDLSLKEKSLRVVPNGMEIPLFAARMNQTPHSQPLTPPDKKVIACIARLDPIKGHRCLLDALAALKRVNQDWVCWLIGDGGARQSIEQQIAQLGLQDDVHLLGDRSDVPALLVQADLCVLPSVQENCPYSIMEAQVAGKTVIASAVGGIPEMIEHGQTGFLTPPQDSAALCQTLEQALRDDLLRQRIGQAAQSFGERQWSLQTMILRTVKVYREALQRTELRKTLEGMLPTPPQTLLPRPSWHDRLNLPPQYQLPDPAFLRVMRGL